MFAKMIKAVRSALRSMLKMVGGVWTRVFGSTAGDVVIDDDHGTPDLAEKGVENAATTPVPDEHDLRTARRRDAAVVRTYALTALVDGKRPPTAPCLSRPLRAWLLGLTASDLALIADATPDQVLQHLHRGPYIQSLHRVRELPPVALNAKTGPAVNDGEPRDAVELRPACGF
jgi:hypothetical protein